MAMRNNKDVLTLIKALSVVNLHLCAH